MKKCGFCLILLLLVMTFASACHDRTENGLKFNDENEVAVKAASAYHEDLDHCVTLGMHKTDVIQLLGAPANRFSENSNEVFFYEDGGEHSPGSNFFFIEDVLVKMSLQGPNFETLDGYRCGMDASEIGDDWALEDDNYYDIIATRYYDADGNFVEKAEEAVLEQTLFVFQENKIVSISIEEVL